MHNYRGMKNKHLGTGIEQMHNYRGMNKKRQGTGDRADAQLQGNAEETPGNWG
jgi:hypothetical protein